MRDTDDDVLSTLAEIYDAIGDPGQMDNLEKRLAAGGSRGEALRNDLELAKRIHDETRALTEKIELFAGAHEQLSAGVVVLDSRGAILRANDAARALLGAEDGLRSIGGCLRIDDPAPAAALADVLAHAETGTEQREGFKERTFAIARPRRRPLIVFVAGRMPSPARILERPPEIVLLLLDPDGPPGANLGLLRELYGLTAREAAVAALLVEGHGIEEAARELKVTKNTVRTLLNRATAKTNSHNRASLVRRLLALSFLSLNSGV